MVRNAAYLHRYRYHAILSARCFRPCRVQRFQAGVKGWHYPQTFPIAFLQGFCFGTSPAITPRRNAPPILHNCRPSGQDRGSRGLRHTPFENRPYRRHQKAGAPLQVFRLPRHELNILPSCAVAAMNNSASSRISVSPPRKQLS